MKDREILNKEIDIRLLDTMTDLIRVVDKDNRVVYYNHAMEQALDKLEGSEERGKQGDGHADFRMTARCLGSGENIQRETYIGETYYSVKTNPIRSKTGEVIGAIEVFRDKSLEKRLQIELIEKNRALMDEQMNAASIQRALLPQRGYDRFFFMDYFYIPAELLSGDFFDIIEIDEDRTAIYIADAVGHGFASSMATLFISQTMRNMDPEILADPTMAMMELVHRFRDLNLPAEMYFTMFLGVFSKKQRKFTYANAGHDCPPLLKRKKNVRLLMNSGFPVTPLVEASFYECRTAYLQKGDELLFYTDGITECRNKRGEQYGVGALRALFSEIGEEPLAEIRGALRDFMYEDPADDMTCVYVKMV